jgi:PhnB protein
MAVQPKPEGYSTVTPYFIVPSAAEFIEFLKQAFSGHEKERHARPDGGIMHAEVRIGDSIVMLGDSSPEFEPTRSSIHLYVDDVDSMYHRALDAGGTSLREPADQIYGDRSAGVQDRFGNHWWLATHIEDVSPEEMQKRQAAMAQA